MSTKTLIITRHSLYNGYKVKCDKGNSLKYINQVSMKWAVMKKKVFLIALFIIINIPFLYADDPGDPGGCDDIDACPLDTWVMILVAGALIFATIHLYRQQKAKGLSQ